MTPADYPAAVWSRFRQPRHAGTLEGAPHGAADCRSSGARLELWARVEGDQVVEARFRALGCPFSIAVGDWLAEQLTGCGVEAMSALNAAAIIAALEIPDARRHCAFVGEDALQALQATVNQPGCSRT
jgi:NifU-like protein involved in Fe-S cluster formation